jgi:hypothetical protein
MRYNEQQVSEQSKETKEKKPTTTPKQGQYTSSDLKKTKGIITGRGIV